MNWQQINRRRMKHIRYGERLFSRMYGAIRSDLSEQFRAAQSTGELEAIVERMTIDADVEEAFNNLYTRTGVDFAKQEYKRFKSAAGQYQRKEEDDFEGMWREMMLAFVANECGEKIRSIRRTFRLTYGRALDGAVQQGLDEGWGVEKISKRILTEGRRREKWQAMRIARTEVLSASNYGSLKGAETTGIPMIKRWVATVATEPRGDHQQMVGREADLDKPFLLPSGEQIMYPGDPGASLEETINCQCGVVNEPKTDVIDQILER